jgi:hypothetical protein
MLQKGRITVAEAASRAFVSVSTIRDWIAQRKVNGVMYAGWWWVLVEDVDRQAARMEAPS